MSTQPAASEPTTRVDLTDAELLLLDGSCRPDTQRHVDAARARLNAAARYDLPHNLARLVADAVTDARTNGRLIWWPRRVRRCEYCGRGGYVTYRSGPRRGKPNYDRPILFPGIELGDRAVRLENHLSLGACADCTALAQPALVDALRDVPAELPTQLRADGTPRWARHDNRRCTACSWEGHDGQMGRARTLMGDGTYPASCPDCGATNSPFGRRVVEARDGFTLEPATD